ncbi:MAG: TSCPD domain-containing protein, partial [Dehalococcoidia bacterium]|nr:TSCPD domain-containing protein [Dehalococcoidia bacterium]
DRSKETQVLSTSEASPALAAQPASASDRISPRKRPKVTRGITERVTTGCGHLYVTVNSDESGICEVFTSLGKAGGCASAQLEAIGRLISLTLRSGVDVTSVVKHLKGIRCPSISWEDGKSLLSCADAIGSVLEKYQQTEQGEGAQEAKPSQAHAHHQARDKTPQAATPKQGFVGQCPDCASSLVFQEGCYHCPGCGYNRC